jgi:hypothetical protein
LVALFNSGRGIRGGFEEQPKVKALLETEIISLLGATGESEVSGIAEDVVP